MKFVHISDTHLGASGFGRRISASGVNQREEDICNSFVWAIDNILELRPDFVLHSGDLFHSVRPSNRILTFAIKQFLKLSQAGIKVVIISGNHDAPKQRALGSVLSVLEVFPNIYPVFKNKYETVVIDRVCIHAIPHCLTNDSFQQELAHIRLNSQIDFNILMLHGVVAGIKEFSMGEFAEQEIADSIFNLGFDYVALGHYHKYSQVRPNVFYAGSTERLSFNEIGQDKGFLEVDSKNGNINFHKVPCRDMLDLPEIEVADFEPNQVLEKIEKVLLAEKIKDKIVRLKIRNISEHTYNLLPFRRINELKAPAFHCDLRFERRETDHQVLALSTSIGRLNQEFVEFINSIPLEKLDRNKLLNLGLKYLSENKATED
ncbi:MAG: hypothetical protein A2145_00860 [candidate division Zixibacteria bacterium RBG_16_40_9]|nr:MAG: hypothetical protein A2145_00860 [candidate division Zixibacteria bacterium RBG_16_40_9]